jgi:transposase
MEEAWLRSQLDSGRSIESVAREVGRSPSTVAYWVNKYGLASQHAPRHAARGGIERAVLEDLVERGLTVRGIATSLGVSYATVQHWLKRFEMKTERARRPRGLEADEVERTCPRHGPTAFVRYGPNDHHRCERCRKERVAARRRTVKAILVAEAGGRCVLCGYDRHLRALHFHHRDPAEKAFGLAFGGVARSLERSRAEAAKCVLLCSNCHAEVEDGIATIPGADPEPSGVARSGVAQSAEHRPVKAMVVGSSPTPRASASSQRER